ncbi:MAG: HDIG domain-containing protein [Desulfovibrio sp.]|uniref:HD domain-containing protein n=1 Tax=Desulfovibrio sp. TaxID=885 RepID=UPI0039E4B2E3
MIQRDEALKLLADNNTPPSLMQHALATEAIMRDLARRLNEDEDVWALTGLLHDLDYPATSENPQRHGLDSADQLAGKLPEAALAAIRAHAAEMNGGQPESRFDYALRCGESITGLISAAALMRPTGIDGMEVKSIKKKMKDKAFAASVSRENIRQCAEAGLELDEFLVLSIEAMRAHAEELGLSK